MKAVVLVGGEGTRLRPLTLSSPKQMLPIVGVPMIERVLGQLAAHGVDEAILSLGYLPDAFMEAYPDGRGGGDLADLRGRARAAGHGGCGPLRRGVRRHRRDVRRRQRGRPDRSRPHRARCVPPPARRGGDDRPPPGGGPVGLRRRPDGRRGEGARLRREAAARRGADERDQRRHLRARAVRAGRGSPRAGGSRSSGRPSRRWSGTAVSLPDPTIATGSTRARRRPISRRISTTSSRSAAHSSRRASQDRGDRVWLEGESAIEGEIAGPAVLFSGLRRRTRRAGASAASSAAARSCPPARRWPTRS